MSNEINVLWLNYSYVVGDQSILKTAGVSSLKDLELLPVPAELSGALNLPRIPGELDYLICTRPGRGAHVLETQNVHLLDPASGLPSQPKQ